MTYGRSRLAASACGDCDREHELSGTGAGHRLAELLDVPLPARIPLEPAPGITEASSTPIVIRHPSGPSAMRFADLAKAIGARSPLLRRSHPLLT